jgi:hypothetical protein
MPRPTGPTPPSEGRAIMGTVRLATPERFAALAAFMFVAELKGLDWLTVAAGWLGAGAAAGGVGLGILGCGMHILKLVGQDVLVLLIEDAP